MDMSRIAFIVEADFMNNHFGVRNYFSTIKNALSERYAVDFIMHRQNRDTILWYKVNIEEMKRNEAYMEFEVDKEANKWDYNVFQEFVQKNNGATVSPKLYFRTIGENLKTENYDAVFITNPWLIDCNLEIDAKHVIGIVHDFIPNQFALIYNTYDFTFSNSHRKGYEYYNKYCDRIMANSRTSAEDYKKYYPEVRDKVCFFKPFVPYDYRDAVFENNIKKENAIVLAAPFDPRKGLEAMPGLINKSYANLDVLYIFGMPRCDVSLFNSFFANLKVKHMIYYPYISYSSLIKLYKKSKILLFPSLYEGLGIPIIEAQFCGCRVMTTDKKPMNELVLQGSDVLSGDLEKDSFALNGMLEDSSFDYEGLSKHAHSEFLYDDIFAFANELLNYT